MSGFIVSEKIIDKKIQDATNSSPGGSSYLSYVANISQPGADIVADVKANTLGDIEEQGTGGTYFFVQTDIDYDASKVWIGGFATFDDPGGTIRIPISDGVTVIGYYNFYATQDGGKLYFEIDFYDAAGNSVTLASLLGTNSISLPEVRVYP
jgi:hypothetical protein